MKHKQILATALVLAMVATVSVQAGKKCKGPKWSMERLPAPEWVEVNGNSQDLWLDWSAVEGATKYSLQIRATATWYDADSGEQSGSVRLNVGTTDDIFTISFADTREMVLAQLGLSEEDVGDIELEGCAKVKALNPGKGSGPQNHPFSEAICFTVSI